MGVARFLHLFTSSCLCFTELAGSLRGGRGLRSFRFLLCCNLTFLYASSPTNGGFRGTNAAFLRGRLGDLQGRNGVTLHAHDRPDRQFLCRPDDFKLLPKLIYSRSCLIGRRRAFCQECDWLHAAVRLKALCTTLLTGRFVRSAVAGQTEEKTKSVAFFSSFFLCVGPKLNRC